MKPGGEARGPQQRGASDKSTPAVQVARQARRELIEELIETGVPAVALQERGKRGTRWLATLYVFIPLLAVILLFGVAETTASDANASGDVGRRVADATRGSNEKIDITAQNISFDRDTLTLKAGARTLIHFRHRDALGVLHNVAIYNNSDAQDPIFQGNIIPDGTDVDYEFTAPPRGGYFFRCDVHPSMNGTVVVGT